MPAAKAADTLLAAARRALAGGEWVAADRAAALLAAAVPDAAALGAYHRLARAGGRKARDRAGQIEVGRSRVVREKLQRLVHRGEAEAAGEGDQRAYRLTGGQRVTPRPKPKLQTLALEALTFDPRLQMRDFPDGRLTDPEWVGHLREVRRGLPAGRVYLEPMEAVDDGKRVWVFDGFQRGEAYRLDGIASVPVLVYPGTFADARLYAVGANPEKALRRRPEDCWKAFHTLVSEPALLRRALEDAGEEGGVERALAAACGLGKSVVGKYLTRAGLRATRKGKLEPVPPDAPKSPPVRVPVPADPPDFPDTLPARAEQPAAPEEEEPETPWRELDVGEHLEAHSRVIDALDAAGVSTFGQLADRLLAGDAFGLPHTDAADLRTVVEDASADDAEPVRFPLHGAAPGTNGHAVPDHLSGKARPGQFAALRAQTDQLLRDVRAVRAGLAAVLSGDGGAFLREVTLGGHPLASQVDRRHPRSGTVRAEWACPLLDAIESAVRRTRVKHECKACGGEGCAACRHARFVPEDGSVLRPREGAAALEFGSPWDVKEEAAEGAG